MSGQSSTPYTAFGYSELLSFDTVLCCLNLCALGCMRVKWIVCVRTEVVQVGWLPIDRCRYEVLIHRAISSPRLDVHEICGTARMTAISCLSSTSCTASEGHRLPWSSMNGTVFCADDLEQQVICWINMVECYTPRQTRKEREVDEHAAALRERLPWAPPSPANRCRGLDLATCIKSPVTSQKAPGDWNQCVHIYSRSICRACGSCNDGVQHRWASTSRRHLPHTNRGLSGSTARLGQNLQDFATALQNMVQPYFAEQH